MGSFVGWKINFEHSVCVIAVKSFCRAPRNWVCDFSFRDTELGGASLDPSMFSANILNMSNRIDFAEQFYDETDNASPTFGQNGKLPVFHCIGPGFDPW